MATFTYVPDWGAQEDHAPRVKVAKFGDGYEQRGADGLNSDMGVYNLRFSIRNDTEAQGIMDFLKLRGGLENFDWTPPGGTLGRYVCRSWSRVREAYNNNIVTAKFEQVPE
jgi:phage-related protein